jgi:hypothetical protein
MNDAGFSPKLTGQARSLVARHREGALEAQAQPASLLIKLAAEPYEATRSRLEDAGASIGTVAGDVVTAYAPVDALDALADLDEVVSIDASSELHGERPPPG